MPRRKSRITKKQLREAFFECERKIGHQPRLADLDKYGSIKQGHYQRAYGTWKKYLASLGRSVITTTTRYTKKQLREEFFARQHALGRQPRLAEMIARESISARYYIVAFGSWTSFLKSVGMKSLTQNAVPNEELDRNYDELKKELGRIPRRIDLKTHGTYSQRMYSTHFGTFTKYRLSRGDDPKNQPLPTREEILREYKRVKENLGKVPLSTEFYRFGKFRAEIIKQVVGGYEELRKLQNDHRWKTEEFEKSVASEFRRVQKLLGRIPTSGEYTRLSKYFQDSVARHFGGWNEFVRTMGETPWPRGFNGRRYDLARKSAAKHTAPKTKRRSTPSPHP